MLSENGISGDYLLHVYTPHYYKCIQNVRIYLYSVLKRTKYRDEKIRSVVARGHHELPEWRQCESGFL